MKRFLAGLVVAGVATAAAGQGLGTAANLGERLAAIEVRTRELKSRAGAPAAVLEGEHRMGHTGSEVQTGATPDISPYSVRGIDVSHYDGVIDWRAVKAAGTSFAFVKSTEGGDYVDADFLANWRGAAAAGIARGAYHFYNFCRTGAAQADNFVKTVPRTAGALPMVLDLERSDDCAKMPSRAAFLKDLAVFVGRIRGAYGRTPILYVDADIYHSYLRGVGAGYRLWIADISHTAPAVPGNARWTFWQYSWLGSVAGIGSETDLDVFDGDAQALSRLARPPGRLLPGPGRQPGLIAARL
jgi:lysozyme